MPKIQTGIPKSWSENSLCVCVSLTRSYLAAGPRLVKEAESGLQLTSVFPDRTKGQCVYVSLANGENALSLLHTPSSPEKSLLAERLLPSQASSDEEGFNPVFKDPKSLI